MHLRVFLRDQPYGVVIFSGLRGRVDAQRQPCPAKRLTPMGLLAGENARGLCCFNREVGAFIGVSGCDNVICGRYCIRIIWISSMESGILTLWLGRWCGIGGQDYTILLWFWAENWPYSIASIESWAVRKNVQKQALRLGPLAGQVLEQSDNPAIVSHKKATP